MTDPLERSVGTDKEALEAERSQLVGLALPAVHEYGTVIEERLHVSVSLSVKERLSKFVSGMTIRGKVGYREAFQDAMRGSVKEEVAVVERTALIDAVGPHELTHVRTFDVAKDGTKTIQPGSEKLVYLKRGGEADLPARGIPELLTVAHYDLMQPVPQDLNLSEIEEWIISLKINGSIDKPKSN